MCIEADCVEEVLTGKTGIALRFDPARGPAGKPFHATNLESGAFVRRGKKKLVEHARQSVSAVVIAGVGCQPPNIFGAMHPRAMRQFDPSLLDRIPFCRLGAGYDKGLIRVEWLNKPPTGSIPGR
jgi:hypothetical protein